MINVTIADDHPLVREGIKKVIQQEIDVNLIGEASDGHELLSMLDDHQPDLVITDITMSGKSGLDLIKDIVNRYPGLPVLVLSIHPAERFALRSLKAGAMGYLSKSSISDELVKAIRKIVTQKRRYITDAVAEQLALQVNRTHDSKDAMDGSLHEILSDREFEVLRMIAAGDQIKTIADKLSISLNTVHTYRARLKTKMNLGTDVEMTRYAMLNDLVE